MVTVSTSCRFESVSCEGTTCRSSSAFGTLRILPFPLGYELARLVKIPGVVKARVDALGLGNSLACCRLVVCLTSPWKRGVSSSLATRSGHG